MVNTMTLDTNLEILTATVNIIKSLKDVKSFELRQGTKIKLFVHNSDHERAIFEWNGKQFDYVRTIEF